MLNLNHKKLDVWKLSVELVKEVYRITNDFPKEEQYGLVSQLRRAAVSVVSNLSEGVSRNSKLEIKRFLQIARSSAVEIDTQFEIAVKLNFITFNEIAVMDELLNHTFAMITNLMKKY